MEGFKKEVIAGKSTRNPERVSHAHDILSEARSSLERHAHLEF
jgi:hypothetical protein